jgi:hypothetical protein
LGDRKPLGRTRSLKSAEVLARQFDERRVGRIGHSGIVRSQQVDKLAGQRCVLLRGRGYGGGQPRFVVVVF